MRGVRGVLATGKVSFCIALLSASLARLCVCASWSDENKRD
jgi:hypothetical protein